MGAGHGGELQGYQTIAQRDDEVHPRLGMGARRTRMMGRGSQRAELRVSLSLPTQAAVLGGYVGVG